ncbi:MAG: ThiF family adenylyltransferase [Candidatus Nanohaloarchaea archaeon]
MYSRFEALQKYNLDKLQNSTAAVIGLGATGSVIAEHLARHGVNLILVDRDYLEMNDLYSSNLYSREQCESAIPKSKAAEEKLEDLTDVKAYIENIDSSNLDIVSEADIIMDGTDNLETRLIIDDYCSEEGVPWVYTAALAEKGFSMFVENQCFRCIFEKVDPASSCERNGIMREISSVTASKSSMKAVKYLSEFEIDERLEMIPEGNKFELEICNCNESKSVEVSSVCGDEKYQVFGSTSPEDFRGKVEKENEYLRKIIFEGNLLTVFSSGRAIVEASSLEEAEKVYREASSI